MAKADFEKIEEELTKRLQKMSVAELLELADQAKKGEIKPQKSTGKRFASRLLHELNWLRKYDKTIYKQVGITKKELEALLQKKGELSDKERKGLEEVQKKTDQLRKELVSESDEELIKLEQKKHIYKRFNVNEKWLPLQ